MTSAYESIKQGLLDAIAYAQGDTTKGRVAADSARPRGCGGQGHPPQDQTQPSGVEDGP